MKIVIFIFVLVFSLAASLTLGRTIGSEIYPTEEELYEAYLIGQIDFQTYLNLREIFNGGIDSTNLYLIEEIPNIDYYWGVDSQIDSDLEKEQTKPFIIDKEHISKNKISGSIRWKRYQKLDDSSLNKNIVYLRSQLSPNWSVKLNGVDEYTGFQECSFRSLNYKSSIGTIRKLVIGNFTARFGLGLNVGYRGKIFRDKHLSTEETILFPDYGGFNGLYAEGGPRKNRVKWLFHYDKNDSILVKTSAVNVNKKFGFYRVEGTFLGSVISNRLNNNEFRQYQLGLLLGYSGYDLDIAIEGALPKSNLEGSTKNSQAVVTEITYKKNEFSVKFSAWYYGQKYINLFGGARSGDLYRTIDFENIDLNYRDRRRNQRGFIIRTSTSLTERTTAEMSISIYGSSRYERFIEIQTSIGEIIAENSRLRLYYELFRKERFGEISNNNTLKLEYNYKLPNYSIRSFLGYTSKNEDQKYLSFHFRSKLKNNFFKEIEFWVNFSRINIETSNIDYFYAYIREMIDLTKTVSLAIKYRYRYNRSFDKPEESTIYLETEIVW
ncbi:MAG: hypothetical protein GY865_00555 [candidate division Zixibacteria bacterium]|nr:hypothetical protein [candidate division Zixibacteria bacterium]